MASRLYRSAKRTEQNDRALPPISWCFLNQPQALHARMTVLADDDVVVHRYAERTGDIDDRLGHMDTGLRRRWIAGGVIVHQNMMIRIVISIK